MAAETTKPDTAASVLEKLKAVVAAVTDGDSSKDKAKEGAKESATAAPTEAAADEVTTMVKDVRARYDSSMTWTVGALVGVGVLIFGSLPFTNAASDPFWDYGAVGLGLVAIGVCAVLWARSWSLEPQDASLGELAETMHELHDPRRKRWTPPGLLRRLRARFSATAHANGDLAQVLGGSEWSAHLGPNLVRQPRMGWCGPPQCGSGEKAHRSVCAEAGVRALTSKIAQEENDLLTNERTVAENVARRDSLLERMAVEEKAIEALSGAGQANDAAITACRKRLATLVSALPNAVDLARQQGKLAGVRNEAEVYYGHRDLVLAESAMAQMRGAFRGARVLLIIGAIITLFGGALYASDLPAKLADPPKAASAPAATPARVQVTLTTDIPGVDSSCRPGPIPAAMLTSNDADAKHDGPFTAFLFSNDPRCTGEVSVAQGQGSYGP